MATELQDYEQAPLRTTFISVLCILTFIGSGWGLVMGGVKYFTADKQAVTMSMSKEKAAADIQQKGKDDAASKFAEKMVNSMAVFTPENLKKAGIAEALAALCCLGGAFLMWQLKKNGYYLYIAGTLIGIISPFVIYGSSNMMSIISSVMVGFVGIVFMILYGVNLKDMR
jgi:hypothetical protein